ncbi:hypothetical protein NNRS527_03058 [Nitrosospira sp. NRS527]|nr:hypothetical protein NNRS527_03058 [Nitrosospira sp. NRS527]
MRVKCSIIAEQVTLAHELDHKIVGNSCGYLILIDRMNWRYTVAPVGPVVTHLNLILPARTWM